MQQNSQRHLRDTQVPKSAWNGHFLWSIVRLWLRHLRFESLYLCQEKNRYPQVPVFFFCEEVRIRRILIAKQQGYWAPIQNLRFCKWVRFLLRAKRVTRLLGTHSKSTILQMGNVLIPLPIRAETAEIQLFLPF